MQSQSLAAPRTSLLEAPPTGAEGPQQTTDPAAQYPAPLFAISQTLSGYVVNMGNDVKLELTNVPGGEFTMEGNKYDDEKPPHQVRLSPFAMGKFEVTQAQWKAVMGADNNPSRSKGDDLPVEYVSWEEAADFCRRLSEKTGETFRLPTEAEWEYAARAGSTTVYNFGDDVNLLGQYAWYIGNSGNKTHPVGSTQPNRFGLFDMHGNVWEWCSDWYGENYYAELQKQGTVDNPSGPRTGSYRVYRGGGWFDYAVYCRSAYRIHNSPGYRYYYLGFRLLRTYR